MIDSNKEWIQWGEIDPLYAVASWEGKAKGDAAPWTVDEFYRLGEQDWADFRQRWERYTLDLASCVEIGCGAGRITKQLSQCFRNVHAVDVSAAMLKFAREHISSSSVSFHLAEGTAIPLEGASVSAVFSCHVFQHFDSLDVATAYFRESARVLKPGGTLMIHLPIFDWPADSPLLRAVYSMRKSASDVRARIMRALMQTGLAKPIMRSLRYSVGYLFSELPRHGLSDVEIGVFSTTSNGAPHPFVFATKR